MTQPPPYQPPQSPVSGGYPVPQSPAPGYGEPVSGYATPGTYSGPPAGHQSAPPAGSYAVPAGYGQPGYSQPGYSQPGYGQPGYGQPGYGQLAYGQGVPPGYAAKPAAPDGRPLAEFSDRLLARLLDGLILAGVGLLVIVPLFVVMLFAAFSTETSRGFDENGNPIGGEVGTPFVLLLVGAYALALGLGILTSYLYEVEYMLRKGGQSVGKRVMKIQIASLQPGLPLTRKILAKRWFLQQAMGLVGVVALLDGLWQLWDQPYKQCLHDKWPNTVVVKVGQ